MYDNCKVLLIDSTRGKKLSNKSYVNVKINKNIIKTMMDYKKYLYRNSEQVFGIASFFKNKKIEVSYCAYYINENHNPKLPHNTDLGNIVVYDKEPNETDNVNISIVVEDFNKLKTLEQQRAFKLMSFLYSKLKKNPKLTTKNRTDITVSNVASTFVDRLNKAEQKFVLNLLSLKK